VSGNIRKPEPFSNIQTKSFKPFADIHILLGKNGEYWQGSLSFLLRKKGMVFRVKYPLFQG